MSQKIITGNWNYPTRVMFGPGKIQNLPDACLRLGMKAPLLITDAGLKNNPITLQALKINKDAGLETGLFADIKPNPTGSNITAGDSWTCAIVSSSARGLPWKVMNSKRQL